MYLRPINADSPGRNLLTRTINSNTLGSVNGMTSEQGGMGFLLHAPQATNQSVWNYVGDYNSSQSYQVNDVVTVNPNIPGNTYTDWDGFPLTLGTSDVYISSSSSGSGCPICPGLFICVYPVPQGWYSQDSASAYFATYGYLSTDGKNFRSYDNIAYPVYPEIPIALQTSSSYDGLPGTYPVNVRYWKALIPAAPGELCPSGQTFFMAGWTSGSIFNPAYTPFTED